MTNGFQLATLLLQIATILALSRAMGVLFARLRQPQVIGEMLAGIMLGPSLLGWVAPGVYLTLFPNYFVDGVVRSSVDYLDALSQVGVVLFLFIVGLEFDPAMIRQRGRAAIAISASSIVVPFAMGFGLAYGLKSFFDSEQQANFLPSALFVGAAISVTAFPVLARILAERNLQRTPLGVISITAAAINDVLAWVLLAVVVAITGSGGSQGPLWKLGLTAAYIGGMLLVIKPLLAQLNRLFDASGRLTHSVVAIVFLVLLLSAFTTEKIGVHALFGAFVAGFIMPKGSDFVRSLTERLEDFTIVFLLPIFFAYAGLRTDLTGIFNVQDGAVTLLIIVVACVGKIGGAGAGGLLSGLSKRDALGLGVLMNTRGLMELIILTVGLELGVISSTVYGMMVIMALVTTAMTAPLLSLVRRGGVPDAVRSTQDDKIYTVLIPVARPESGGPLLEVAAHLAGPEPKNRRLVALHLDRMSGADLYRGVAGGMAHPAAAESLAPLLEQAEERGISVEPQSYFSRDIASDIARLARSTNSDLVLIGHHTPVFGRALLGGVVHRVLTGTDCDVAVFVDRDFQQPRRILVPFLNSTHDRLALDMAGRIARGTGAAISIIHVSKTGPDDSASVAMEKSFTDPTQKQKVGIKVVHDDSPIEAVLNELSGHDLVVIGVSEEWGLESSLLGFRAERIATESPTSLLIVRRYQPSGV